MRSSLADASTAREGLQWMALTSSLCPRSVRSGARSSVEHSVMVLSLLHAAKSSSLAQSTSSTGAAWKANCCASAPVAASHTHTVLSTEPVSSCAPPGDHCTLRMGCVCPVSTAASPPPSPDDVFHIRARPS